MLGTEKPLEKVEEEDGEESSLLSLNRIRRYRQHLGSRVRTIVLQHPAISAISVFLVAVLLWNHLFVSDDIESLHAIFGKARWQVETAKGRVSYDELEDKIYRPMGLDIIGQRYPFAHLARREPINCERVFTEWNSIAANFIPEEKPREKVPDAELDAYLMNGYSIISYWYENGKHNSGQELQPLEWSKDFIEGLRAQTPRSFVNYERQGMSVYHAMQQFNLTGKVGLIVGSLTPWVETLALKSGAAHVTTAEYQKIIMSHPQMVYVHPIDLGKNFSSFVDRFDFVVSYSSIEHSGLGRYGDPYDPIGDFREIRCQLKSGGIFYLGLPMGVDSIIFNAHRRYGRARLPILFEGFELLAVFEGNSPTPLGFNTLRLDDPVGFWDKIWLRQYLFVLRKL